MATNTTTSRIEQAKLLGINHNTLTNWHKNKNFQKWFEKQLNENMFKTLSKTAKEGLLKIAQGKGGWVEEKEAYVAGKKTGDKEVKRITTPTRDQVKAQETILKLTGELTEKVDVKSVNVNVDMDAEAFLRSQVIKQEQRPKKLEDV
ncbi:MAG: hypothetical protein KKH44_00405 [Bacteroidetes bacterium]|nr:hypothetical protein [Bacteroidota bacterium]